MAKLTWVLYNSDASIDFTSSVKYFTYNQGRQSVLDNYAGGTATITMKNDAGQVAGAFIGYRQKILIKCEGTNAFIGWVQGIDYNDTPTGAASTATITLGDAMVLAGQQIAEAYALTSYTYQIEEIGNLQFYPTNIREQWPSDPMQLTTYTGDWASRLNQIVASDRGRFMMFFGAYYYIPIDATYLYNDTTFTFGRTASASVIAYQSLDRVKAIGNQTYVNQAQINNGFSTQTATSLQALVVGTSAITVAAVSVGSLGSMNRATWIANSMADPEQQSFAITCTDIAQTTTAKLVALLTFNANCELAYTPPGGVTTSQWVAVEGVTVRGFIDHTEIDFSLGSFTYYRMFMLNDTVMGVLDSSRLGY